MLGFLRNMLKWGVARWSDAAATGLMQPNGVVAQFPRIFKFPNFKPYLLASLVAGATYSQSGNTVTVTATGHGLPTNKNGYRFFWPGSVAIAAGWYEGFEYVDANTFTFINPASQAVPAGTALTAALPYLSPVQGPTLTLPGGSVGATGGLSLRLVRSGDSLSAGKYWRLYVAGVLVNSALATTSSTMSVASVSAYVNGVGKLVAGSFGGTDNTTNTSANMYAVTVDLSADQIVDVRLLLSQASQWQTLEAALLEVIQ